MKEFTLWKQILSLNHRSQTEKEDKQITGGVASLHIKKLFAILLPVINSLKFVNSFIFYEIIAFTKFYL